MKISGCSQTTVWVGLEVFGEFVLAFLTLCLGLGFFGSFIVCCLSLVQSRGNHSWKVEKLEGTV